MSNELQLVNNAFVIDRAETFSMRATRSKATFRQIAKDLVDLIPLGARTKKTIEIAQRLQGMEEFSTAECIMIYTSRSDEVGTTVLLDHMTRAKKRVAVPVVNRSSGQIIPCEITGLHELQAGTFGIMEPPAGLRRPIRVSDIDLIVVPGRAFDIFCNRLGRGKGYFDRFLKGTDVRAIKVGLAFDELVFDSIPHDLDDIKMDVIVTDKRIQRCKNLPRAEGRC